MTTTFSGFTQNGYQSPTFVCLLDIHFHTIEASSLITPTPPRLMDFKKYKKPRNNTWIGTHDSLSFFLKKEMKRRGIQHFLAPFEWALKKCNLFFFAKLVLI